MEQRGPGGGAKGSAMENRNKLFYLTPFLFEEFFKVVTAVGYMVEAVF